VVELFDEKLEQTNARQLSNSWEEFNRRVSQEMYPIIHFDYDVLFQMINFVSFYLQCHNYWLICFV
jgi:hypothetical protein